MVSFFPKYPKVFLIFFTFLTTFCTTPSFTVSPYSFSLKNLKGETVSLKTFQGKTFLIDFWATWCPPCCRQLVNMNRFLENNPQLDCLILFVSVDSQSSKALSYIQKNHPHFQKDPRIQLLFNGNSRFDKAFEVRGIPSLFLIGKKGKIQWRHTGLASTEDLKNALNQIN